MNIKDKLASLPKEPGVYLMKNSEGQVLYVGKAKSLKARVSSYFRSTHDNIKTSALVKQIKDFEVIIVRSEVEALFLERTLIKHQKPPFNVLLRDDKEYPLLRIDLQNDWPRIQKVRRRKDDGALYLGPYGNVSQLNLVLAAVFKIFPLIRCSEYEFEHAKRPCNYYHMKQCLAPCSRAVDKSTYRQMIDDAVAFLQGHNQQVLGRLKEKMKEASEELNYEAAAFYRDQLEAIKQLNNDQVVVVGDMPDTDVIGLAADDDHICLQVLIIRNHKLMGNDHFHLSMPVQTSEQALVEFLLQYYDKRQAPSQVLLPFALSEQKHLQEVLAAPKTCFSVPLQGKKKKLIDMACRNARFSLDQFLREQNKSEGLLVAVKTALQLPSLPRTIECLDISHIQGTATVASIVCFVAGKPAKSRYRKYNLADEAEKPDDFQSIFEVMSRRLARARREDDLPDLFVIDGGKGQLSAALRAAEAFPEVKTPMVGLAKSRLDKVITAQQGDPFHSSERVFLPDRELPIELEPGSLSYRLLTQLRDEAHRFAITHHRQRRAKVRHSSLLEEVKGIGPQMRKRLYAEFHDLDGLKKASLAELKQVKGLGETVAEDLYKRLHAD